jgi:hypothetical protein
MSASNFNNGNDFCYFRDGFNVCSSISQEGKIKENDYEIENQRANEEVILVTHMHPWVFAKAGMIGILLVLAVVGSFMIWGASSYSVITLTIATVIVIAYSLLRAFLYKNTVFILTNLRIINITQSSLFHRKVQEMELGNIYNLQYKINGPVKSFMNFGDIELTTMGSQDSAMNITNIENPHFVYEKISHAKEKISPHTPQTDPENIKESKIIR